MQEEREKKKADQLEHRKDLQRLADDEMNAIKPTTAATSAASKLTRAEIESRMTAATTAAAAAAAAGATSTAGANVVVVDELPLEENVNRLTVDGLEARSVDEAIKVLR